MTVSNIKVKLQRTPTVKAKVLSQFPASISASAPLILSKNGASYNFALDSNYISDTVTPAVIASIGDEFQPVDPTLTALSGLDSSAGLVKQTGTDTFAKVAAPSGAVVGTSDTQTLTNKTINDPKISRIYGGTSAGSSLTLQSTNNGTPSSDAIYFVTGNTIMGGWGGGTFASNVFSLRPDGTNYRFAVSDTSAQLHYDNIVLGKTQFDGGATGGPNVTWKTVLASNPDVVFGSITGNNTSSSNHAFQISAGGSGNHGNPIEVYTEDGSNTSTLRLTIPGGSSPSLTLNNIPMKMGAANYGLLSATALGVNFNSANTDTQINIPLPAGFTRYRINSISISNPSIVITTATFGVFSATGGGGTTIVTTGTATALSSASVNTSGNCQTPTVAIGTNVALNFSSLQFRVQTAQGAAATADVAVNYFLLP